MIYKKILSILLSVTFIMLRIPFSVAATIKGDANGDGELSIRDAAFIAGHLSKGMELNSSADYNNDGKVDIRDASSIACKLVSPCSASYFQEMLSLVNNERAKVGAKPLTLNLALVNAANVRADEISEVFSHKRPDGSSFYTVLDDFSIEYYCSGENIAAGFTTAEITMEGWINSPSHYENIINPDFTQIGIGYYYDENSTYKHHWVQLFKCD